MSKLFGIPVDELAVVLAGARGGGVRAPSACSRSETASSSAWAFATSGGDPGRSVLIVVGSMLGTAIIAAALATGDTMGRTVRTLGDLRARARRTRSSPRREWRPRSPRDPRARPGRATSRRATRRRSRLRRAAPASSTASRPSSSRPIAVQDLTTRQNEPRATLFAGDPESLRPFGDITSDGKTVSLADLTPGEVYPERQGRRRARRRMPATRSASSPGTNFITAKVKAIVRYDGGATDGSGLLLPLSEAQRLLDKPGSVKAVFVSNTVGPESGAKLSGPGHRAHAADALAARARGRQHEGGRAERGRPGRRGVHVHLHDVRLVLDRRRHPPDLPHLRDARRRAAQRARDRARGRHAPRPPRADVPLRGSRLRPDRGRGRRPASGSRSPTGWCSSWRARSARRSATSTISYSVKPASLVLAYTIGVLLTLAVVAFSAWRVSRMNIVTAIRDLPDPPDEKGRRRRWILGDRGRRSSEGCSPSRASAAKTRSCSGSASRSSS